MSPIVDLGGKGEMDFSVEPMITHHELYIFLPKGGKMNAIILQPISAGTEPETFSLVKQVADKFVCPDFTAQGVQFFFQAVHAMLYTPEPNLFTLTALEGNAIVGMIAMRDNFHICLFFVDERHHGQGIGRALLDKVLGECIQRDPAISRIEVNSSPYAVPVYSRLGFRQILPPQHANGIVCVPMEKTLVSS
jgi:GNAT superfamily N-acetyltransferase